MAAAVSTFVRQILTDGTYEQEIIRIGKEDPDWLQCRSRVGPVRHAARRGLLNVKNPEQAAYTFTWLIVSIPSNRAAFLGDGAVGSEDELMALADEGARVFLAAYRIP